MKNVLTIITAITLSSMFLVSCSNQNPTSPLSDTGNSSMTMESQTVAPQVLKVVGGQVTTQSISATEQIGTAIFEVEQTDGSIDTLYAKLHGVITSQEPTLLSHSMEVYADSSYKKFLGMINSEGDVAVTIGFEYPLVTVQETVNIVSGTKKYVELTPASTIVVVGTLNMLTGQNHFAVISGQLVFDNNNDDQ